MWFKNLYLLKIRDWQLDPDQLEELLSKHALQCCGSSDMESIGWVRPKGDGHPFVHRNQRQLLIALGIEKKLLPSSVIDQYTQVRADEIEEQQGNRPGRKQMKEIKERVEQELLPRAFSLKRQTLAWIDPVNGWFVVNASSEAKAAEVIEALRKITDIDAFSLEPAKTLVAPMTAMTGWLVGGEPPPGFTVDRDCELRDPGEEKATVRYVHHNLDAEEIPKHIEAGKTATKLALTWADKISFVLTDGFLIKRIAPLDLLKEQGAEVEDMFDGDFAIMSGELGLLLADLESALGGLVISEHPALPGAGGA